MADLDFEEKLWQTADKMRNNIDPAEYKHVVLGLIFLKYISDSFDEKYKMLLEEGEEFEEDRFYGKRDIRVFSTFHKRRKRHEIQFRKEGNLC